MVSVGNERVLDQDRPWAVDRERTVFALQVVLPKRTYVWPWTQFLYAEGTPAEVLAHFALHDVVVTGCGLEALLADLAARDVTVLRQPLRVEKFEVFTPAGGRRVVTLEVRRVGRVLPTTPKAAIENPARGRIRRDAGGRVTQIQNIYSDPGGATSAAVRAVEQFSEGPPRVISVKRYGFVANPRVFAETRAIIHDHAGRRRRP